MDDIPNLTLFAAKNMSYERLRKGAKSTIFCALIEVIYFILGWKGKEGEIKLTL